MQAIPLAERLRKRVHKTVAAAEDILVMESFNSFPGSVLHGGTAIWRCYKGNRFSEDVDLYLLSPGSSRLDRFIKNLDRKGLRKQKLKATENTIFGKFSYLGVFVRFEASLRTPTEPVLRPFELLDGGIIMVRTLSQPQLILEKVSAYLARRKVRDLYDIFFLLQTLEMISAVKGRLSELLRGFRRPVDEAQLRAVIISGSVPTVENMLEVIRNWAR